VASSSGSFAVPATALTQGAYDLYVSVRSSVGALEGTSAVRQFTIDYVDPAAVLAVDVTPRYYAGDLDPTGVDVTWSPPSVTGFEAWEVYVREEGAATR
jgi:hypothetical protein